MDRAVMFLLYLRRRLSSHNRPITHRPHQLLLLPPHVGNHLLKLAQQPAEAHRVILLRRPDSLAEVVGRRSLSRAFAWWYRRATGDEEYVSSLERFLSEQPSVSEDRMCSQEGVPVQTGRDGSSPMSLASAAQQLCIPAIITLPNSDGCAKSAWRQSWNSCNN